MLGVESAVVHLGFCVLVLAIDILSAYELGRRVHARYPDKADGKFKSKYVRRVVMTLLIVFLAIIAGDHIDRTILVGDGGQAVKSVMWAFVFYEVWSIVENWSSENDNKLAKVCQRIMVNKAERHFKVEIKDLFDDKDREEEQGSAQ